MSRRASKGDVVQTEYSIGTSSGRRFSKTDVIQTEYSLGSPSHNEAATSTEMGHMANAEDHGDSKWQSAKRNPWACFWCGFAIWTTLLVSYENQASGNVLGIPEFRKDFGSLYEGNYVLNAQWQSAFSGGPVAASVFGALTAGQIADWIGRRYSLMAALVVSVVAITLEMVSTTNELFFVAKFINGIAVGILASVTVTYIGEIVPLALRGLMTCLIAFVYTFGPFTVALVVNSTGNVTTRWAYRSVFASQYGFWVISAILVPFMPESPWWLCSKGQDAKAIRNLRKLGYSQASGSDEKRLAVIKLTLEEVKQETEGVTYMECFRKSNLRRTMIAIAPLSIQALSGVSFAAGYFSYYAQLAGYSTAFSYKLSIIQQVLSMLGNITSWFIIDRVGRRNMTFYGLLALTINLLLLGGLAVQGSPAAIKGTVGLILVYCFLYNMTIGATAYALLAEVATSRLRIKTIAIGLATQQALFTMWGFVLPYIFNPNYANLGAKTGFIFGGLCVFCLVYLFFCQPETSGRSYEELDEMFIKRVPARKFKTFRSDAELKGEAVLKEKENK